MTTPGSLHLTDDSCPFQAEPLHMDDRVHVGTGIHYGDMNAELN